MVRNLFAKGQLLPKPNKGVQKLLGIEHGDPRVFRDAVHQPVFLGCVEYCQSRRAVVQGGHQHCHSGV